MGIFTKIKSKSLTLKLEITFFCIFVLLRVFALGHDNFNTDVWKWKSRIYDFGTGVFTFQPDKTLQKYHPGVTLMWVGSIGVKIFNAYYDVAYGHPPSDNSLDSVFGLDFVQKILIVIVIGLTLCFVLYVLRNIFDPVYAFLSLLLIAMEPFYVALTRVIHLEGLMSTFMLASFVWLFYYFQDRKKFTCMIVSAVFTGLAVLTKTSALFMLPFTGLALFLFFYFDNKKVSDSLKNSLVVFLKWLVISALVFVAVWPIMWTNPGLAVQTMFRGVSEVGVDSGHAQFYFGKFVEDPGWTFYFVVLALRSSVYLLVGLAGFLFIYKKLTPLKKQFAVYTLVFSLFYLLEVIIPSKKLDRYILPSILGFLLLAGLFYEIILGYFILFLEKVMPSLKNLGKYLWAGVFIGFLMPGFLTMYLVHPDYFSYFNPLFGGLKTGIYVIEPKWLIGESEIISYLTLLKERNSLKDFGPGENIDNLINTPEISNRLVVGFQEKYYTQIWPFVKEMGGWAVIQELRPYAVKTGYFVYPVWDDTSGQENRFKLQFIDSIKIRGVESYRVYKRI